VQYAVETILDASPATERVFMAQTPHKAAMQRLYGAVRLGGRGNRYGATGD
jgi:hypothetical protein